MGSVLYVCKANVCRSPLMAFLFESALAEAHPVAVRSAGTMAVAGGKICAVSARVLASRGGGADYASRHRSVPITASQVSTQDLVLVASREERALLATRFPAQRSRVFTLREGLALSRDPLTNTERSWMAGIGLRSPWTRYAALLDRRRGSIDLGDAPGRFPWSKPPELMDIPDAHQRGAREHVAGLNRLTAIMDDFGVRAGSLLDEIAEVAQR